MKLTLFLHLLATGVWLCCLLVALICDAAAKTLGTEGPAIRHEINSKILLPTVAAVLLSGCFMAIYSHYLTYRLFVAKMVFAAIAILAMAASVGFSMRGERDRRELAARRIALPCLLLSLGIGLLFFIA